MTEAFMSIDRVFTYIAIIFNVPLLRSMDINKLAASPDPLLVKATTLN